MLAFLLSSLENDEDKEFVAKLFEECRLVVYKGIREVISDSWAADDVLMNTFVDLIVRADELRTLNKNAMMHYVFVAGKNHALNYLRNNKKHKDVLSFDEELDSLASYDAKEMIEEHLISDEYLHLLPVIWDKLVPRDQELLERRFILRQSNQEIATLLNLKPERVRVAVLRARRAAHRLLDEELKEK